MTLIVGYKAGHPRSGLAWGELAGAYFDQAGVARAYVARRSLEAAVALLCDIDDEVRYGLSDRLATGVDVLWAEIHQERGEPESARAGSIGSPDGPWGSTTPSLSMLSRGSAPT